MNAPQALKNGNLVNTLKVLMLLVSIGGVVFTVGFNWANTVKKSDLNYVGTQIKDGTEETIRLRIAQGNLETRTNSHDQCLLEIKQSLSKIEEKQLDIYKMISALQAKIDRSSPMSRGGG